MDPTRDTVQHQSSPNSSMHALIKTVELIRMGWSLTVTSILRRNAFTVGVSIELGYEILDFI